MGLTKYPSLATTTSFLLILLFLFLSPSVSGGRRSIVGGRTEIKGVRNNKEVQELGRFSIKEYNRMHHRGDGGDDGLLLFLEVVEAQRQVVAGIKYYLKIEAVQHGVSQMFESVVSVVPWRDDSRQSLEFGPYKGEDNDIKVVAF